MEAFLHFIKLDLLVAQPQTFVYWLFCFSFLERQPPKLFKRLAIFAAIHSVYTDIVILNLPFHYHVLNSMATNLLLLFILFKELPTKQKVYLFVFANLFALVMDLISSAIIIFGLGITSHSDILRDNLPEVISVVYPMLIIIVVASWFIRKRNIFSAKRLFTFLIEDDRKTFSKIIFYISIQFSLLALLQFVHLLPGRTPFIVNAILIYASICISLIALVTIIRLLIRTREQAVKLTQEVYIDDINNMFTSIRGQRHDFLNHVQVIHSMAKMKKFDQLTEYTEDLAKDTQEMNDIIQHPVPALAAFIQAKMTVAIGRGIAFTFELPEHWNGNDTSIKLIDIVKILGNLVDNAFDETCLLLISKRRVHVSIEVDSEKILLQVSNHGRILDEQSQAQIFQSGYSTKGAGHSGLGLAIINERVHFYKGKIQVQSNSILNGTLFQIEIPRKEAFAV